MELLIGILCITQGLLFAWAIQLTIAWHRQRKELTLLSKAFQILCSTMTMKLDTATAQVRSLSSINDHKIQ
jgi:hypothetical protein